MIRLKPGLTASSRRNGEEPWLFGKSPWSGVRRGGIQFSNTLLLLLRLKHTLPGIPARRESEVKENKQEWPLPHKQRERGLMAEQGVPAGLE